MAFLFSSPITYAWEGGAKLTRDPQYKRYTVSRQEYEEHGHNICMDKFDV